MIRSHAWRAFALFTATAAACGGKAVIDPMESRGAGGAGATSSTATTTSVGGTSVVSSSVTTSGMGGAPPECVGDGDCAFLDDLCVRGLCDAGSCVPAPEAEGTPCDDDLFCTPPGACSGGLCVSQGSVCPIIAPGCMMMTCDEVNDACVLVPDDGGPCDDGDPCTGDGVCGGGSCLPAPVDCTAFDDACNVGLCGPNGCFAQAANEGGPCNDGDPCTTGDACQAGTCIGGGPGTVVYFSETFDDNSAGWTLGPEWAIGPAMMSSGQSFANPDPGMDHSASGPDGVAGIQIGGNKDITLDHPYHWLESAPFDATVDPGPVVLQFYRWLNSDWTPWMNNRVEVFDGMSWVTLWESGPAPAVQDNGWVEQVFDVTPYKNPSMRIRFGVEVGQSAGAFVVSSWNVDDVLVTTALCP